MSKTAPTLSVVLPVYNEQENIEWFYQELTDTLKTLGATYELVYVNDGSKDATQDMILKLAQKDTAVRYICLARNFGKEAATSAGIHYARGEAIIILDGDGQHPSDKIPEMVQLWRDGAQQVVGIRESFEGASIIKKLGSKVYYGLSKFLGSNAMIAKATDFRLIDRELADVFSQFTERKRMTRSLLDWSGYTTKQISFNARERKHGDASYKFSALLRLALSGYIGSTLKPLYFIGAFGIVTSGISFLVIIFLGINQLLFNDVLSLGVSGTAFIALFVTLLVGLIMLAQGIIAAYIANIQLEAQNRPLYLVNKAKSIL
jgi:dolichol-phosphate mannosyltransferase